VGHGCVAGRSPVALVALLEAARNQGWCGDNFRGTSQRWTITRGATRKARDSRFDYIDTDSATNTAAEPTWAGWLELFAQAVAESGCQKDQRQQAVDEVVEMACARYCATEQER